MLANHREPFAAAPHEYETNPGSDSAATMTPRPCGLLCAGPLV